MITWASRRLWPAAVGRGALIRLDVDLWHSLLSQLRDRGDGRRESGAFLLAERNSRRVTTIVYLDDLDPDCLTGGISFNGIHYDKLWRLCSERGLAVIADVHTHPRAWVGQSPTDRENPMIAKPGHVALIVPSFAQGSLSPAGIGVHRYLGDAGWSSAYGRDAERLVYVGRFA